MVDLNLIAHIYDVALGRAQWDEVLARLRAELHAEECLLTASLPGQAIRCLGRGGNSGRSWTDYAEHFDALNPCNAAMTSRSVPAGTILTGEDVLAPRLFLASEFYNDWCRPNGLRYTAWAYMGGRNRHPVRLALPRGPEGGPYSLEERARLQVYFNHLYRAVLIADELGARTSAPDFDRLAKEFGLTPAEARLVQALVETGSLQAAAQGLRRSYYTARSQLQSVFAKTRIHSQTALMRLIHRPPASEGSPAGVSASTQ